MGLRSFPRSRHENQQLSSARNPSRRCFNTGGGVTPVSLSVREREREREIIFLFQMQRIEQQRWQQLLEIDCQLRGDRRGETRLPGLDSPAWESRGVVALRNAARDSLARGVVGCLNSCFNNFLATAFTFVRVDAIYCLRSPAAQHMLA